MGFGLKKLFKGAKKIIKKNKRGLTNLAKVGLKTGLGIAAPIVGAKLATVASGAITRVVTAPARRKLKAEKADKLSKALAAQIQKPMLTMMSSRETNASSAMPGGAPVRGAKGRKSSTSAMPGGAPVSSGGAAVNSRKGTPLGVAGAVKSFTTQLKAQQREQKKITAARIRETAKREKQQLAAQKAEARKQEKARKALVAKQGRSAKAAQKRADKEGSLLQNVVAGAVGAKASGKGTMAGKINRKVKSVARQTASKTVKAIRGSRAGAAAAAAGKAALRGGAAATGLLGALTIGRARKKHIEAKAQAKSIRDTGKVLTTPMT